MISIELTNTERRVLLAGITEWGGPAMCTDALAVAMGFMSTADLHAQRSRLFNAVRHGADLDPWDWARVLVLTEVVFASNTFGSGIDWSATTGLDDTETIQILRGLQRTLTSLGAGRQQFQQPDA